MYTRRRFVDALRGHVKLLLLLQQLIYSQQIVEADDRDDL